MRRAVFIDKDGTLIPDLPHNVQPDLISLSPDCITGLKQLREQGFMLIVISNQAGVAKGLFKEPALENVKEKLITLLEENGLTLEGFYYCPHHPEGVIPEYSFDCICRKPAAGLFFRAAQDHDIDLSESWMVGDILNDVEAGNQAGCRSILIDNGNETEWVVNAQRSPVSIVKSINDAAAYILENIKLSTL